MFFSMVGASGAREAKTQKKKNKPQNPKTKTQKTPKQTNNKETVEDPTVTWLIECCDTEERAVNFKIFKGTWWIWSVLFGVSFYMLWY